MKKIKVTVTYEINYDPTLYDDGHSIEDAANIEADAIRNFPMEFTDCLKRIDTEIIS